MEDVVRALGYLALGSRFRRIGESLQADAQRLLDEIDPRLPAGQHPLLYALDRHGPLTVGELAAAVGVAQPGVTRSLAALGEIGLVAAAKARGDQRRRVVALTVAGERFVAAAKLTVWRRVEEAVADLCAGLRGPLLAQLAAIEDGLAERPLSRRAPPARAAGAPGEKPARRAAPGKKEARHAASA